MPGGESEQTDHSLLSSQVGEYTDGQLTLTDRTMALEYAAVETTCDGACLECNFGSLSDEVFTYIPGDIVLAGIHCRTR